MAAVARVEGGFSHQPMHAGFRAQPAVGVIARVFDGGAFHPRHFPGGGLDQFRLELALLAPAQIHAQQHLRPILGLGAAGTGLDLQEGVVRVHLAGKHAAKLQGFYFGGAVVQLRHQGLDSLGVAFLLGEGQQLFQVPQTAGQGLKGVHGLLQRGPLLAQGLGPLLLAPYAGIFEGFANFLQAFNLRLEVKDTSSGRGAAPGSL